MMIADLYNVGLDQMKMMFFLMMIVINCQLYLCTLSRCDTKLLCKRGVLSPAPPDGEPQSWAQAVRTRTLSPRPSHAVWPRVAQCPPLSS